MAVASNGQSFDWVTSIPWIVAIVGTLINLLWNFVNYRKTTGLQKTIRQETVRLEEFRRVRTPIDGALGEIGNERANLAAISQSATPINEWRQQVNSSFEKIVLTFLKLQDALNLANSSQYTSEKDWLGGVDPIWDSVGSAIDRTQNQGRPESECRAAAGTAAIKLGELSALINSKIDREVQRYTSPNI